MAARKYNTLTSHRWHPQGDVNSVHGNCRPHAIPRNDGPPRYDSQRTYQRPVQHFSCGILTIQANRGELAIGSVLIRTHERAYSLGKRKRTNPVNPCGSAVMSYRPHSAATSAPASLRPRQPRTAPATDPQQETASRASAEERQRKTAGFALRVRVGLAVVRVRDQLSSWGRAQRWPEKLPGLVAALRTWGDHITRRLEIQSDDMRLWNGHLPRWRSPRIGAKS